MYAINPGFPYIGNVPNATQLCKSGCDIFLLDLFPFSEERVKPYKLGEWRLDAFLDLVQEKLADVLDPLLGFSEVAFNLFQI